MVEFRLKLAQIAAIFLLVFGGFMVAAIAENSSDSSISIQPSGSIQVDPQIQSQTPLDPIEGQNSKPLAKQGNVEAYDLGTTLTDICRSTEVREKLSTVQNPKLSQDQRFNQLLDRRMQMRVSVAFDALERSLMVAEVLLPLLALGPVVKGSDEYFDSVRVEEFLKPRCDFLAKQDPKRYAMFLQNLELLSKKQTTLHSLQEKNNVLTMRFHDTSESYFSMILKGAYEKVLLQKLEKLFHHPSLQFGLPDPKKFVFPAIYPVGSLTNPGETGYPVQRNNQISHLFPVLDRPARFLGGFKTRFMPVGSLAEDLFERYFQQSDYNWSPEKFFVTDNGNQAAVDKGLGFGNVLQWTKGKYDKVRAGRPQFRQLVEDIQPRLSAWLNRMMKISDYELYVFLRDHGLEIPGEHSHTFTNGKIASVYGNQIPVNQRRLIAAWQLLLRFDLPEILDSAVERAYQKQPDEIMAGLRTLYKVAEHWMEDLKGATSKLCEVDSAKDLAFIEEHPAAVAHNLMDKADSLDDQGFWERMDGFCNAGTVRPTNWKSVDKWLAKPWGMTRRTQGQNALMASSTVLVITGGLLSNASIVTGPMAPYAHAAGWGLVFAGSGAATVGSAFKAQHVLSKLQFDSALSNPTIKNRRSRQTGALWHAVMVPLHMYGFLQLGKFMQGPTEYIGMAVAPPFKGAADMLIVNGSGKKYASAVRKLSSGPLTPSSLKEFFGSVGSNTKDILKNIPKEFRWAIKTQARRDQLKMELGKILIFGKVFISIHITTKKFEEIGIDPSSSPAWYIENILSYLNAVLMANMMQNAGKDLKSYLTMIGYTQAETYVLDMFVKHSLSLAKGSLPDSRYLDWTLKFKLSKETLYNPVRTFSYKALSGLAGESVLGAILIQGLWDYILLGYTYSNAVNSVIADYNTNRDIGYFEAWGRLEFRDFHVNPKGSLARPQVENRFDGRDPEEFGLVNLDEDTYQELLDLADYYSQSGDTSYLDSVAAMRIELLEKFRQMEKATP